MRIEIEVEKCEGCGICVSVCPKSIFYIENGKAETKGEENCIRCMACEINCPYKAIRLIWDEDREEGSRREENSGGSEL